MANAFGIRVNPHVWGTGLCRIVVANDDNQITFLDIN